MTGTLGSDLGIPPRSVLEPLNGPLEKRSSPRSQGTRLWRGIESVVLWGSLLKRSQRPLFEYLNTGS